MKNRNKMNNNGFSLVELIIVIAIMAVLIGVLAPQYMKYVEKGKVAADDDNMDAIVNAIQVWAVDPDATSSFATGTTTITLKRDYTPATDANTSGAVKDALENAGLSATLPKLTNRQTFATADIKLTVSAGGEFTVEIVKP